MSSILAFFFEHHKELEQAAKISYWIVGIFGWLCVAAASLAIVYAVTCWRMGW